MTSASRKKEVNAKAINQGDAVENADAIEEKGKMNNTAIDQESENIQNDTNDQVMGNALLDESVRLARAEGKVKDHMLISMGIGLIPIPLLDLAAFAGSGIFMIKKICDIYDVPFKGNRVRSTMVSMASSLGSAGVAAGVGLSMGKIIPGFGSATGMVTLPIANAAFMYAVGKMYIAHFELGGTLLDLDPNAHLDHFKDLFKKGKKVAASLRKKKGEEPSVIVSPVPGGEPPPVAV